MANSPHPLSQCQEAVFKQQAYILTSFNRVLNSELEKLRAENLVLFTENCKLVQEQDRLIQVLNRVSHSTANLSSSASTRRPNNSSVSARRSYAVPAPTSPVTEPAEPAAN